MRKNMYFYDILIIILQLAVRVCARVFFMFP